MIAGEYPPRNSRPETQHTNGPARWSGGDDIGLSMPSASELELTVRVRNGSTGSWFHLGGRRLNYMPGGKTLVKRGSTVIVVVGLEG